MLSPQPWESPTFNLESLTQRWGLVCHPMCLPALYAVRAARDMQPGTPSVEVRTDIF